MKIACLEFSSSPWRCLGGVLPLIHLSPMITLLAGAGRVFSRCCPAPAPVLSQKHRESSISQTRPHSLDVHEVREPILRVNYGRWCWFVLYCIRDYWKHPPLPQKCVHISVYSWCWAQFYKWGGEIRSLPSWVHSLEKRSWCRWIKRSFWQRGVGAKTIWR